MNNKYNILVGQSGGPTAVINASLYGVIQEALNNPERIETIYGMVHGVEGFLNGQVLNLTERSKTETLSLLTTTPASYLGSCRYKLPSDLNDPVYPALFKKFEEMNIGAFLYIGGNDSMDTVSKLSAYAKSHDSNIRVIGVPKTIDNDLVETDHCPGFGSTAKYVASTVRNVVMDASVYMHPVVTIIELMGRHAGWVTAASVLARTEKDQNPLLIYLPEADFDMDSFVSDVKAALTQSNSVIVCVSEGISDKNGTFICEYGSSASVDGFGHKMLTGCGKVLEGKLKQELGIKCRSIELNLPQRCSSTLASKTDVDEAVLAGSEGVKAALAGETGKMVAFVRENQPYQIHCRLVDVSQVCNKEKIFPIEWIKNGNDIDNAFIDYVLPLIQGENPVPFENGLPKLLVR